MGYRRSEYARLAPSVYLGEPAVCDWVDARFFRCPRRVVAIEGGASWRQSEDALAHSLDDQWGAWVELATTCSRGGAVAPAPSGRDGRPCWQKGPEVRASPRQASRGRPHRSARAAETTSRLPRGRGVWWGERALRRKNANDAPRSRRCPAPVVAGRVRPCPARTKLQLSPVSLAAHAITSAP